jgi:hypothetical protein
MAWRMRCTITIRCPFRRLPMRTTSLCRRCLLCPVNRLEAIQMHTARLEQAVRRPWGPPARRRQGIPSWKRGPARTLSPTPVWRMAGDMRKLPPGNVAVWGKADSKQACCCATTSACAHVWLRRQGMAVDSIGSTSKSVRGLYSLFPTPPGPTTHHSSPMYPFDHHRCQHWEGGGLQVSTLRMRVEGTGVCC